jgi:DNA-binding IclR family transcriptional regulator
MEEKRASTYRRSANPPIGLHDRIPRLLSAFSSEHTTLTLSALAAEVDLPLSTTHRIASHLVEWGALEHDGRNYVIGLRLFEIATLAPRAYRLRDRIHPFLEELLAKAGENVLYAVMEGTEVLLVEQLVGHRAIKLRAALGSRLPMHASAMGQVMLAFGSPTLLEEVAGGPMRAFTDETITDPMELKHAVRRVRRNGYAISHGAIDGDSVSISAPVIQNGHVLIGAISIVSRRVSTDVPLCTRAVLRAARGISQAISSEQSPQSPVAWTVNASSDH